MKPVVVVLCALLVLLQYQIWFTPGGIISAHQWDQTINAQQKINQELATRNTVLLADINDLKTGNEAIAEHARNDLGMIKQGEVFYQIVEPTTASE